MLEGGNNTYTVVGGVMAAVVGGSMVGVAADFTSLEGPAEWRVNHRTTANRTSSANMRAFEILR